MDTEHDADADSVDLIDGDIVRQFARAALVAALLGAFAYVAIPVPGSSVPITLQVFGVFLAGLVLGPKWGPISVLLYLAAGAIGAPVFSGGTAGLGVLQGPTAGYLWSWPLCALAIGLIVHRGTDLRDPSSVSLPALTGSLLVALAITYTMGTAWLGFALELEPAVAIAQGVVPFVLQDLLKVVAAVAIVRSGALPE